MTRPRHSVFCSKQDRDRNISRFSRDLDETEAFRKRFDTEIFETKTTSLGIDDADVSTCVGPEVRWRHYCVWWLCRTRGSRTSLWHCSCRWEAQEVSTQQPLMMSTISPTELVLRSLRQVASHRSATQSRLVPQCLATATKSQRKSM